MTSAAESQGLSCEIDGLCLPLGAGDLTLAGLFVQTTMPPDMDVELTVHLLSPLGQLEVRGHVVQVVSVERATRERRRPGFGLLFTDLSDDQRAWIGLTLDAQMRARRTLTEYGASTGEHAPSVVAPSKITLAPPSNASSLAPPGAVTGTKPRPPKRKPVLTQASDERAHAADAVAHKLRSELSQLQNKPPWSVLGLTSTSSLDEAKAAFLTISKRCHPHLFARHESPEVSKLATEVFIAYKRAYSVLTKLAPRDSTVRASSPTRATMRSITPAAVPSEPAPSVHTSQSPKTRARTR